MHADMHTNSHDRETDLNNCYRGDGGESGKEEMEAGGEREEARRREERKKEEDWWVTWRRDETEREARLKREDDARSLGGVQ